MQRRQIICVVLTAAVLWSAPLFAAVQLTPVVSGLSSPIFVGHAGDGSNRLFIVEQGGIIKVLQPGSSTPTTFLDIRGRIVYGGERGLLGLAFHPQYAANGRFFVFYTRTGDNALIVAEYRVTADPNVASTTERRLLTIPHPNFTNHNGGMLAFGQDGYLYIGVGDGGSANDPSNNAQNINVLLGKILRIDIDRTNPTTGARYTSPPDNPFVGRAGADEIFAYGLRNPWRFSFDRLTGQAWVGDVGQGAREEVDTPLVNGGNYGWRVYEGSLCTNVAPSLCNPTNYVFPLFDYSHTGGRCSLTGGYVYRGSQGVLADGAYLYGDYCSGEIFVWSGAQSLLLDTALNISSFGEDEQGELYVVGLGGTVSKLTSDEACAPTISPTSQTFGASGGSGSVSVTGGSSCSWTAVANAGWLHVTAGGSGTGNGLVTFTVDANPTTATRTGSLTIAGRSFSVTQSGQTAPPPTGCRITIAPRFETISPAGATRTVEVTAPAGCPWTAVSQTSWITVTGGASGTGNGVVTYVVPPFNGPPRQGAIDLAGFTFRIRQLQ